MRIKDLATRVANLFSGNAYFVVDNGTKVEKVTSATLAQQTLETYNGSTLAGTAQSVKAAIDALNSKMNTGGSIAFTLTNANPTAPIDTYLNSMGAYEGRWIEIQIDDNIAVDGITVPPGRRLASIFRHSNANYAVVNMYGWAGYQVVAIRSNGTWTWKNIATNTEIDALNSKVHSGVVSTGTDLDDITTVGVYMLSGNNTYTHSPSPYGILEVLQPFQNYGVNVAQRLVTTDVIYSRYKDSSGWYAWKKVTLTNVQ